MWFRYSDDTMQNMAKSETFGKTIKEIKELKYILMIQCRTWQRSETFGKNIKEIKELKNILMIQCTTMAKV